MVPTRPGVRPPGQVRLYCFPYSGAGASAYRRWGESLPAGVEVVPVELPGRETRFGEPPFDRMGPLVEALGRELPIPEGAPFALFGHSLGALVAFELARRVRRSSGALPVHLFVSACRAPHLPRRHPAVYDLPEPAFRDALRAIGGTPGEILENEELMEIVGPVIRADYAVCDTYRYVPDEPLDCPLSAFGALDDPIVAPSELEGWKEHTRGPFRLRLLPGGHLFLREQRNLILRALTTDLSPCFSEAAAGRDSS